MSREKAILINDLFIPFKSVVRIQIEILKQESRTVFIKLQTLETLKSNRIRYQWRLTYLKHYFHPIQININIV